MRIGVVFLLLLALTTKITLAQSAREVDSLLKAASLTTESKNIRKNRSAKKLISYGRRLLPILRDHFTDSTVTQVSSACLGRSLTRGEVAIIIADQIEPMPYFTLTGIQNCLMDFCKGNPNLVEYYLDFTNRDGVALFSKKYSDWLVSDDRKKMMVYAKK